MGRPLPMQQAPRTVTVTKRVRATAKRGTGINTPLTPMNSVIAAREATEKQCLNKDNWANEHDSRGDATTAYSWNMTGLAANEATIARHTVQRAEPEQAVSVPVSGRKKSKGSRKVDTRDLHFSAVVRYSELCKRSLWPTRTLKNDVPKRYRADVAKLCGIAV